MTVRRADYCWRALNSEMVEITRACPTGLFQLQASFMFWMVRKIMTIWHASNVANAAAPAAFWKRHSNLMRWHLIPFSLSLSLFRFNFYFFFFFFFFSHLKANIRQLNIQALHPLASLKASYLAQHFCCCFIIVERASSSTSTSSTDSVDYYKHVQCRALL